jgi:hypothetical protein
VPVSLLDTLHLRPAVATALTVCNANILGTGNFGPGALDAMRVQYKQYIDAIVRDTAFKVRQS